MTRKRVAILAALLTITILFAWFGLMYAVRPPYPSETGWAAVGRIEAFKRAHGRYPTDKAEAGLTGIVNYTAYPEGGYCVSEPLRLLWLAYCRYCDLPPGSPHASKCTYCDPSSASEMAKPKWSCSEW